MTTRGVAAFEATGDFADDGAHSAAAWLAHRCHIPSSTARARLRLGRALRHLPVAKAAAWLSGEVGEAQRACWPAPAPLPPSSAWPATRSCWSITPRACASGTSSAAWPTGDGGPIPTGQRFDAAAQREQRHLHLSPSVGDMWFLDGLFDPVGGEIVARELHRLEQLFAADWAEAKARVGEGVRIADVRRSPAQRRADALVEMATRSPRPRPTAAVPSRSSTSWWATRPSPGPSVSWPAAPWRLPPAFTRGSIGPGWSGWCSKAPAGSSTTTADEPDPAVRAGTPASLSSQGCGTSPQRRRRRR